MSNFDKHFKKETILEKTKNSVSNLINYNESFKNNVQYPGEPLDEMKIKQLLLPVYDKIYEIKEDLLLFSELNSQNSTKNISTKKFNEMQHLHTNILFNKNIIDDTLNYMKEKIENVNYEQINKEFQEIEITLENLKKEMEDMVEEFNNKYEKILKEKKRQKIAEELMKGEYNKVNKNSRLNMENGDFSKFKNNLEIDDENRGMDYDRYKYDINGIDEEKENLMIQYLEDKQKAMNGLPKLVPPNQKVNFNYDEIKSPNFKNLNNNKNNINNYINTSSSQVNNINNNTTSINNENNINQKNDDNIKDINFNENNINNDINNIINNNNDNNISEHNNENFNKNNNNIETNINNNNKEYNSQVSNNNNINNKTEKIINSNIIPENDNNNIPKNNYMQSDYNNEENNLNGKDNIDPTETLNNFKEKMSAASKAILTGPTILPNSSQKSKQKSDPSKKAYDSYMRNIQPRSSGSKITYQNFKKPNKPRQKIIQNEFKKKPNRYNVGKYPSEYENNKMNEFLEKNP